jgi:ribokinase
MKIAVAGSLNMDMVVRTVDFPRPGETIFGKDFATGCGGKGANQAVGCGRLGGEVAMVGCVGADDFGNQLIAAMQAAGVNAEHVVAMQGERSGCALITIAADSQNSIVVVPGANARFGTAEVDAARPMLGEAGILLLQLETPVATNRAAAGIVRASGGTVILDPAPANAFRQELMESVDIITPNRTEAEALTGMSIETEGEISRAIDQLRENWPGIVILKMGEKGAYWKPRGESQLHWSPPFRVRPIDTVAAGDAFNAGLAVALSEGKELREAIDWASAAGALCVTRRGAQEAMPSRDEVLAILSAPRAKSSAELAD